jgi:hypothetical protein
MANEWLSDVVLLNESNAETRAGDISVFRSAGEACGALEPWWVQDREGFAFTASGDRLTLGVDDRGRVIVAKREQMDGGATIVLGWLRASAEAVLGARRSKAKKGKAFLSPFEEQGRLPASAEGLIAYVGFRS